VDQIVAEQDRAYHPLGELDEPLDEYGAPIAAALDLVHARARRGGEGGFRSGKKGGENKQPQDAADCGGHGQCHRPASSLSRNVCRSSAATSRATKAAPMPRARMKVSLPPTVFLSRAISASTSSLPGMSLPISATRVGRPQEARWAATRALSPAGH